MLQEFTWQQFLVAAMVLSFLWYGAVWFFYLRHRTKEVEISRGTKSKVIADKLPHYWERDVVDISEDGDLMGKTKLPEGMSLLGSNEVNFSGDKEKSDQLGLIPDLLQELKILFQKLAEKDGTKSDFLKLLEELKTDFPKMDGHPQLHAVNEFIVDHAPFHLTQEDIENLWY